MMRNYQIKFLVSCLLVTALASPMSARAETIFIKCEYIDILSVNLTNNTVNNTPADITPIAIDWEIINQHGDFHFHIDRTLGTLTTSGTYYRSDGNLPMPQSTVSCAAVDKPTTKF